MTETNNEPLNTGEKVDTSEVVIEDNYKAGPAHDAETVGFDVKTTKRLVRKIDYVIIPFVALLYLLSFLDRTNIGNARLAGLERDLGMSGLDYNVAVAVFFPGYILSEVPSNMMLKKFRPSVWIPTIMTIWAICTTLMGVVHNFGGLVAARVALGFAEGGLFPGVAYYITMWYRKREWGFRLALFFSAATAAGAFGGLLARGIMEMDGVGGKAGWAWIFILEGLATLLVAIVAYYFMTDYPMKARFLTQEEKYETSRRLTEDRTALADEYNVKYMLHAFQDWKIWVNVLITIGNYTNVYSVSLFLPTIVRTLGYADEEAQLMSVPPYVVACAFCIGAGYAGDRLQTRGVIMMGLLTTGIVGLIMVVASNNYHVKYAGCVFAALGIFATVPQGVAWTSANAGGTTKRGVAIALHVGGGNCGGLIAAFIFLPQHAPRYVPGLSILIGLMSMSLILSTCMTIYYRRENARRDRVGKPPSEYSDAEMELERGKGDYATFFRYVV